MKRETTKQKATFNIKQWLINITTAIKFWFNLPQLVATQQQQIESLQRRQKALSLQLEVHEHELERLGSLLTATVDVHMKQQPSVATILWRNPTTCRMECKAFEIDEKRGMEKILQFLHSYRLPSGQVFFDAAVGIERHLKEGYKEERRQQGRQ